MQRCVDEGGESLGSKGDDEQRLGLLLQEVLDAKVCGGREGLSSGIPSSLGLATTPGSCFYFKRGENGKAVQ